MVFLDINKMIEELGVSVKLSDTKLDTPAIYFDEIDLIIIDCTLNDINQKYALLHELGHAAKNKGEYSIYTKTKTARYKMERQANEFMVNEILDEYIATTGVEPIDINYLNFAKENSLPDSSLVENVLKHKIGNI